MESSFIELTDNETYEVVGGALGGAVAGWIFGGCAGMVIWMASGGAGGATGLWKCYTSTAITGAAIGAWTPV